jgi:Flp pilus assembly protein TadG
VLIQKLWSDRGGNFGIMTALLAVPLILAAGSALDISTAMRERTDMQGVADSAALAGAGIYNGGNANAAKAAPKLSSTAMPTAFPPGRPMIFLWSARRFMFP